MTNITTIELKKTTHTKLQSIGGMAECFDDVINRLLKDHEEINKYIHSYIERKNGECVCEVVLGRAVIANHFFGCDGTCEKCGISPPIVTRNDNSETVIEFQNECITR